MEISGTSLISTKIRLKAIRGHQDLNPGREAAVDVHDVDDHQEEVRRCARPSPRLARCLASSVITAPCSPPLPLAAAPGSPPRRPAASPGRRRARLAALPA
uniref:Uncharacterized protein n=1 Tax=Oryza sativa subsp. japonica TaxID=39947 RepID=Q6Z9A6_ORYSJ|nr:hypothetical protein [Oryza sativa Japonica Group]